MKTKILLTILTIAILSSPLLAQRDSLCMRTVDEWYRADSSFHISYDIELVEDYIYMCTIDRLWIFSLSDSGLITSDTTLFFSRAERFDSKDTIGFVKSDLDLIVLNISNPNHPDSIIAYPDFFEVGFSDFFIIDSMMYLSQEHYPLKRYSVEDPFDIFEIFTVTELRYVFAIDFPFAYGPMSSLSCIDLSGTDTLLVTSLGEIPRSYIEQEPQNYEVQDTFIYVTYSYGALRSFKTNSSRDTLILLDTWEDFMGEEDCYSQLHDSLLFVNWETHIKIFNVSNPSEIDLVAYYHNPDDRFIALKYLGDFLVVNSFNGLKVFEYPCSTCDGNCELEREIPQDLEIKTYPNPFNDKCRISIDNKIEYTNQSISIYDLKGRKVLEENTSSLKHEFIWDAQNEPKGIYLVQARIADSVYLKKIVLL